MNSTKLILSLMGNLAKALKVKLVSKTLTPVFVLITYRKVCHSQIRKVRPFLTRLSKLGYNEHRLVTNNFCYMNC